MRAKIVAMAAYQIGGRREEILEVASENAITFLGMDGPRVLSTPQMILHMERVSRNLILPMLDPGHDTLGTHVNVAHRSGAPIGSTVVFSAELLSVNERRAQFRVEARKGDKVVGEGTHERAIVDIARLREKLRKNEAAPG